MFSTLSKARQTDLGTLGQALSMKQDQTGENGQRQGERSLVFGDRASLIVMKIPRYAGMEFHRRRSTDFGTAAFLPNHRNEHFTSPEQFVSRSLFLKKLRVNASHFGGCDEILCEAGDCTDRTRSRPGP
jgi:hypothetical protein